MLAYFYVSDHSYSVNPETAAKKLISERETNNNLNVKLKNVKAQKRRLVEKVKKLETEILKMKSELSDTALNDVLEKADKVPAEILKRHKKIKDDGYLSTSQCHPAVKSFALTLHMYSAKAYR